MIHGIVGGFAKGMKLRAPKGEATRPTSNKVRQAVISTLHNWIPDGRVLDLFAGSGSMGLEFLSRGAQSCVFVEKDRAALACIEANLANLKSRAEQVGRQASGLIIGRDLNQADSSIEQRAPFDVVWADPPYHLIVQNAAQWAEDWKVWLAEDGLVVLESSSADMKAVTQAFGAQGWICYRERKYGATAITMWQVPEQP